MYTNLALEQQRQLAYKCPADTERSPQQALLRKNQVVVALLSLAVDVDPGNGNAWLHLSSVHHRAGDDRRTMDALTKGTEYGREDGHLGRQPSRNMHRQQPSSDGRRRAVGGLERMAL